MWKIVLKYWVLAAIIISGLFGIFYGAVQQVLRSGADDPQIQLAEDTATSLMAGKRVEDVISTNQIDIATSLAPYIIVFDAQGKPVASSARLNGRIPAIPAGIFDYVRQNGEDRLTWQPQPGVRSAIVVTQVKGANPGFVLAGRSLREVEKREDNILHIVIIGWAGLLLITFVATIVLRFNRFQLAFH